MNPQPLFCPYSQCPSRGRDLPGNIRVHQGLRNRWFCKRCGRTFSLRAGTPLHGLKTPEERVLLVLALLAYGCPPQAIVAAFGLDERTLKRWQKRAGEHCEGVQTHLLNGAELDLGQVQADEIRVKTQRGVVWMALALCVSTRLWLGGVVSKSRDKHLARALARLVHACARCAPLLLITDGWSAYKDAWHKAFRTKVYTGGPPRLVGWTQMAVVQVLKQYQKGRAVGIRECRFLGDWKQIAGLLPGDQVLNTAYIERLNATFRQRLCCLVRRGRALARLPETLTHGMYLVGSVYNFCTPHQTLTKQKKTPTTPAMAAGLTDYIWSVSTLFLFRLPPVPVPKKPSGQGQKKRMPEAERRQRLATV
jgi:transposase-like protein